MDIKPCSVRVAREPIRRFGGLDCRKPSKPDTALHSVPSETALTDKIATHEYTNVGRPRQKVGCDLFNFQNKKYIALIDYYSRYTEVAQLNSTLSSAVIIKIKEIDDR